MTPDAPSERPLRLLLVEDDLGHAHLIRFLLEDTGRYEVTLVQDGLRGIELAEEGGWALVITDLNLPGAYGMAVIEASRAAHPDTPILATTGYTGPEYAEEADEKGADAVLLKPLERERLLDHVAALIELRPDAPGGPAASEGDEAARGDDGDTPHVLAIGLRPGEVEAGCGATLLRHAARGNRLALLVLSQGRTVMGDRARTSARRLGARFFIGSAPEDDPEALETGAADLLEPALREIRPDALYLPTPNRRDPVGRPVAERALELAADVPRVFCYDPGDPTADFRPGIFVPAGGALDEKLKLMRVFDFPEGSHLHAAEVATSTRFWGRYVGGRAAEALEVVRGESPWDDAARAEEEAPR